MLNGSVKMISTCALCHLSIDLRTDSLQYKMLQNNTNKSAKKRRGVSTTRVDTRQIQSIPKRVFEIVCELIGMMFTYMSHTYANTTC